MANIIKTITDILGNKIYPKTKEMAVYDENNVRLDNKLVSLDNKFKAYDIPSQVAYTQPELDNLLNASRTTNWYRMSIIVNAALTLLGGVWYIEGFVTSSLYEWQVATSYDSTGSIRRLNRSKFNGVWGAWLYDIDKSSIVQSDTVTDFDKVPSAYVMNVVSNRVNALINKVPFTCTPSEGRKFDYADCYTIGKTAYFNISIQQTDGSLFGVNRHALCIFPQVMSVGVTSFSAVALNNVGTPLEVNSCIIGAWDKIAMANTVVDGVKTIFINGYFNFN